MACTERIAELVELAREGRVPGESVRSHLLVCAGCAERYEAEVALSANFGAIRQELGGRRSAYYRRAELLKQFDALHPKPRVQRWWGLAAAAVVLLAAGVGIVTRFDVLRGVAPQTVAEEISDAQKDVAEAGFIAVPFVPPLAQGELVRVIHTELQPAELASLGVNVDPTLSADLPADLLVGADGFPRAVRITDEFSGAGGY